MQTILTGIARRIDRAASIEEAEAVQSGINDTLATLGLQEDAISRAILLHLSTVRNDFAARRAELEKLEQAAQAKAKLFRLQPAEAA